MLEKIQGRFSESIQIQIAAAEVLPKVLSEAANRLVACLLRGKKIIICAQGRSYGNAQLLNSHLSQRYDMARPSFASLLLQSGGILGAFVAQEGELNQLYKKQLQAVANEGDILIAFSPLGNEEAVINAIHAALNENLEIIAFTGSANDHTQGLLGETHLEIAIPSSNEMRIIEGHQFSLNLLCELVDHLLFS